jgi:type II secretory pathway pseudopilin PulG
MRRNNFGFTFVEIIIALGLSAILLPALGRALSFSIRVASQGEKFSQAYALAQQGMENMYAQKSQNWSTFTNSTTTTVIAPFTRVITIVNGLRCGFKPTWEICTTGSQSDPDTKKVTVVVSWPEAGGPQNVTLDSYVTNH